jgi:L-amino acid N-acyltransferase YncA
LEIWQEGAGGALGVPVEQDSNEALPYFAGQIAQAKSPFAFWVAEDVGGRVVGWQWLMPFHNNPTMRPCSAESSTYVASEAGGKRVGELLLRHAMAAACSSELKYVVGFVVHEAAERLVIRCGWERVGAFPFLPRHRSNDLINCFVFAPGEGVRVARAPLELGAPDLAGAENSSPT